MLKAAVVLLAALWIAGCSSGPITSPSPADPPDEATVDFRVLVNIQPSGRPIAGELVTITRAGRTPLQAVTASDGLAAFRVAPGLATVSVRSESITGTIHGGQWLFSFPE
jgi:hypothetical protein